MSSSPVRQRRSMPTPPPWRTLLMAISWTASTSSSVGSGARASLLAHEVTSCRSSKRSSAANGISQTSPRGRGSPSGSTRSRAGTAELPCLPLKVSALLAAIPPSPAAALHTAEGEDDQPQDQAHDQDDPQCVHGEAETAEDRKYQQQRKKSYHAAPRFPSSEPRPGRCSRSWRSRAHSRDARM